MLDKLNQPKGSTIGVLRDGRSIQEAFDGVDSQYTLNDLRTMEFSKVGQKVHIKEHTAGQGAGGGTFKVISMVPGNYADDNGCQIVTNKGVVLRRDTSIIVSDMFGLTGGGDIIACLRNMFKASRSLKIEEVKIARDSGGAYRADTTNGGFEADITDGLGFYVQGIGVGNRGPRIIHKGPGVLFKLRRDRNKSSDFWSSGGFSRLVIYGRSDNWEGTNNTVNATVFRVSDVINAELSDLFIDGYKSNKDGAAISLFNQTGWTEMARLNNIMVRSSAVVLRCHRDKSGNGGTDSFFGLSGNIDANAGASIPTTYLYLGDGTEEGKCFLYGHDLRIRGWMSSSAGHVGIRVTDHCTCTSGKFDLVWDGYGISSTATAPVITLIRTEGSNSRFDCEVTNRSGQSMRASLAILQPLWDSMLRGGDPTTINASLSRAYPSIRAKGMVLNFQGTFSLDETKSGKTFQLSNLLPGQRLRVRLNSWENDKYQLRVSEWDVLVQSIDFPAIVVPVLSEGPKVTTTTDTGTGADGQANKTFLTGVSVSHSGLVQSPSIGSKSLRLSNGRPSNAIGYSQGSGLKVFIELPADPSATVGRAYNVEIEIL